MDNESKPSFQGDELHSRLIQQSIRSESDLRIPPIIRVYSKGLASVTELSPTWFSRKEKGVGKEVEYSIKQTHDRRNKGSKWTGQPVLLNPMSGTGKSNSSSFSSSYRDEKGEAH